MNTTRLQAQDRRAAIIAAVRPLVARKGLNGTTTKEMAIAAGVSEALIFRHFPSKQALYDAIVRSGAGGDPAIERLLSMAPSTATLVHIVRLVVRHFVMDVPGNVDGKLPQHRLMLASLMEDGQFARLRYGWIKHNLQPLFVACVQAAEAAGDLVPSSVAPENRLWFAEHLGAMFASLHLSGNGTVPYGAGPDDLAHQMTWFLLRGIGFKDTAIAVLCAPAASSRKDGSTS
ncbi:MAG: TetR/AcrR family transcriptional regulator [Hyphomicrobiaceae bacterium]